MKQYYVGTLLSIALELIQINAYVIYNNNIAVLVHPCCTLFGFIKNTDVKLHTFLHFYAGYKSSSSHKKHFSRTRSSGEVAAFQFLDSSLHMCLRWLGEFSQP